MAFTLILNPKGGLFKAKTDHAALLKLFGGSYAVGGVGPFSTFKREVDAPGPEGEQRFMLYGLNGPVGRGFYLTVCKNGDCELTSGLPTTTHDLEDLFTVAGILASVLDAKNLATAEGSVWPRTSLKALFSEVKRQNFEVLKSFSTTDGALPLTAVRMPFYLPQAVMRRIDMVPAENGNVYLTAYLDDKQRMDYQFIAPSFLQEGEDRIGSYVITEGVPGVIPKEPFVPCGAPPFDGAPVSRWLATLLPLKMDPLGTLPYADFLARLAESDRRGFDERHWLLRGLSVKKLSELLQG